MPNYKGTRRVFTEDERAEVRQRYLGGESAEDLAEDYGCAKTTIWGFVKGLVAHRNRETYESHLERFKGLLEADMHWVAGIIDGEGWVGIAKNSTFLAPRVNVTSTDDFMIPELERLLGGNTCTKSKTKGWKDLRCWDLYTLPSVRAFCEVVGPALRVKQERALVVATFCASRMIRRSQEYTDEERALVKRIRFLNKRGV